MSQVNNRTNIPDRPGRWLGACGEKPGPQNAEGWLTRRKSATISRVSDQLSNVDALAVGIVAPCFPVTDLKASLAHYVGLGFTAME